jgi:hypothetical protein
MKRFDVFNGDADGICALHQLRLAEPAETELVTGVKRDIALLQRVAAGPGDCVTVLDVSLDTNRDALSRLLAAGARVTYFDHHFAGEIPASDGLEAHIDPSADVCTGVLVDRHLGGRFRAWAIVAAFGDGLRDVGQRLVREVGLSESDGELLARLGECLNYNAYGESVGDLWFDPAALYRSLSGYVDPLAFARESDVFARLEAGYRADMGHAEGLLPLQETPSGTVVVMPDLPWARRVSGVFANNLASRYRARAHAILTAKSEGGYLVSVRAPKDRPVGADALCRGFATGGGRKAAAGINHLPESELVRFLEEFQSAPWGASN